jgi:hypothetical protein
MFLLALPAAADQPGTNEDPFGGLPITGAVPDAGGRAGIVAKFGLCPWGCPLPGGFPSKNSGDGASPRKAIYIGGIWAGISWDPVELRNCATVKIPAGSARWFKLDTWKDRRVRIWLDDEESSATQASGSAVFGAADMYMWGTAPGDAWQKNALDGSQVENFLEGFVMAVYDPDNLRPNFAFAPPNAAILTLNADERGFLQRGPDNLSLKEITGAGIHGYGSYNPGMPNHLLWYEGQFDGWVYVRVSNQMIWDGVASVCSQRVR